MNRISSSTMWAFSALLIVATLCLGAASNETGQLKIVRSNPTGQLGQPISVEWMGSVSDNRTIKTKSEAVFTVPAGWYQVSCSPLGQSGSLHSVTVHVKPGGATQVRCFFAGPSSQKPVTAMPPVPVPEIASSRSRALDFAAMDALEGSPASSALIGGRVAHKGVVGHARARSRIGVKRRGRPGPQRSRFTFQSAPVQNTENYDRIEDNGFKATLDSPLSTVSIDVDTAAYANSRRFIEQMHRLPPKDAVRIEEFINYFDYDYAQPEGKHPFSVHSEVSVAPWNPAHRLVHIGLQGKDIDLSETPPSNLVFLIDVSGSMNSPNKLPLLVQGFKMLVQRLRPEDRVAIVVYASRQGLVLPSTPGSEKAKIIAALDSLRAGGSTAGGAGIQLAYKTARANFVKGGTNRVILATDGDFNVGVSSTAALERMIEKERESDVFLTILGFGRGNYKDARMERLSNKGNGNAAYIDSILEARKVLVKELGGTLMTIAKDVKIQIEFNPAKVKGYRLIGYENRVMAAKDFNDDKKDAGELGAGHTVTALYEVIPAGSEETIPGVDPLKYQSKTISKAASSSPELLTVKLRYKAPTGKKSTLVTQPLIDHQRALAKTSNAFRFSAAVAEFGMLLRKSEHRGNASFEGVLERAQTALGTDKEGYRAAFMQLVRKAQTIAGVASHQGGNDEPCHRGLPCDR